MDLSVFVTVAKVMDIILAHWEISLVAFIAFIILFIALFKGIKRGIRLLLWVVILAGIGLCGALAVVKAREDLARFISFCILWVPTILFVATVLISTLIGAKRGLRKSAIFLTHAVCAAGLCIGLYFFCISNRAVDEWLLKVVNHFMGGGEALQNKLGVGGATLREVFTEYLPTTLGYGSEWHILFSGNDAYVMTLVDVCYRIGFAFVFYLLYMLLVFLLYIVYHIFYSERKYRRKKNLAFAENKTDASYKKRRIGGGIIGFVRGFAAGLISLSFMGSAFYVVAGGTGDGKLADYRFGNKNTEFVYSIYRSVESYGTQGIFKVLNSLKDPDDTPYYLFAADLIFSGGLEDEKNDVSGNIKFREELGAYVGFARDTMDLLMRYGEEDLTPILEGEESSPNAMNVILNVMKEPGFQVEFDNLIDNFDSKTYIINFSLSLADTVIANIDDISFTSTVNEDNKELLKVLFSEGHLSDVIPDERELKAAGKSEVRPCFNLNHLLTKRDAQIAMKAVLAFLSKENTLDLVKKQLPQIEQLSIFGTKRKDEMNPVLGRMYCYLENKFLGGEGYDGITYKEIKKANIAWGEEIRSLVSVSENLIALYENLGGGSVNLDMLRSLFDEDHARYGENIGLYDGVCEVVSDSALLGKVLSSGYMMKQITNLLKGIGNVYIPENVEFDNLYDGSGNLVSHGEIYQFFYGLRLLGDKENKSLMDAALDSFKDMEFSDILDMLEEAFAAKDKFGNTLSEYFTDSVLLRSVISCVFIERGGEDLIVPTGSRERDLFGYSVNLIRRDELKELFAELPRLNELVQPLLGEESDTDVVTQFIKGRDLFALSGIISATVVNYIVTSEEFTDSLNIPVAYLRAGSREKLEKYDETNIWYDELPALITALDEIFGVGAGETADINKENVTEKMFNLLKTMNAASLVADEKTKLDVCYASNIIKNDLTIELDKSLDGNVDVSVITASKAGGYYKHSEIGALSDAINQLDLNSFEELENYDATDVKFLNDESETHPGSTRLDVLYESLIVAGLITDSVRYSIQTGNGALVDHAGAYRKDVKVYKKNEIQALASLLGENEVESYKLNAVSELKPYVAPDSEGEPESYLVAATVSKNLFGKGNLVIPESCVQGGVIAAHELVLLIDAYSALNGDGSLDGWDVGTNMVLPSPENRESVINSTIMRATMTYFIVDKNNQVVISRSHVTAENDCNGKAVAVICEEQLSALFDLLEACGVSELVIPNFKTIADIAEYEDALPAFCAFNATYYNISSIVLSYAENVETAETFTMLLGNRISLNETTRDTVSIEEIYEILKR